MISQKKLVFSTTVALVAAGGIQVAAACSLANWSDMAGTVIASQPDGNGSTGAPTAVARYDGLCGFQADGAGSLVQDNRPNGISRIVARFYVKANGNAGEIYRGFGDEVGGTPRFVVSVDASNNYTLTDSATGQFVSQAGTGGWDSVEIDWTGDAGAGSAKLTVNGDPDVDGIEVSNLTNPGTLDSVRLGVLTGSGLKQFDAYESRRSTSVKRLCNCNANGSADNVVNIQDVIVSVNEVSGTGLTTGTPDCNEDGAVAIQDIITAVNIISNTGLCVF